jgi:Phage protein
MNEPTSRTIARDACYGIAAEEIARRCRVDVATARRWKRGARCPPRTAVMILLEDLGCFDPAWKGWRIRDGQLMSPEGWAVSPGDVLALPLMRAQIASYQLDQRLAKAELEALEEQPEPGAALKLIADRALRG